MDKENEIKKSCDKNFHRLPIVQGGTFSFLVPTKAILETSFTACKNIDLSSMTADARTELWQERMVIVQGAIIVSSLLQIIIGFTGITRFHIYLNLTNNTQKEW